MIITKEYILQNRTENGSWTKSQMEAIGIDWPPTQGWMNTVIDNDISVEMMEQFESKAPAKIKSYEDKMHSAIAGLKFISDKRLNYAYKEINKELKKRSLI